MQSNRSKGARSPEQVREHYELEKLLAAKLNKADRQERRLLYSALYNELLQKIPHHPRHNWKENEDRQKEKIDKDLKLLKRFLDRDITFLEIGKGDSYYRAFEISKYVRKVYAMNTIDFPDSNIAGNSPPENFEIIDSDGINVNIDPESIHIVLSNNRIEHLHPLDAVEQVQSVYNCLVHGGEFLCLTPHRFRGPSDISRKFDDVATGFHLKEYTNFELYHLFKKVGFSKIKSLVSIKNIHIILPVYPIIVIEYILKQLPYSIRKKLSKAFPLRPLLSIFLVATK